MQMSHYIENQSRLTHLSQILLMMKTIHCGIRITIYLIKPIM